MITENVSNLKIHKLTQAQYDNALANGTLDQNALYLTPDDGKIPAENIVGVLPVENGGTGATSLLDGMAEAGTRTVKYNGVAVGEFSGNAAITYFADGAAKSIGNNAFYGCVSLEEVNIPNTEYIGSSAFQGCTSLKNAQIPNCKTIELSAFYSCTSLKSIDIRGVVTISDNAFWDCSSISGDLSMPMCTTIGGNAFRSCSGLRHVYIGAMSSLDDFGYGAISGCSSIFLEMPLVSVVPSRKFMSGTYLSGVSFQNCTTINVDCAFEDCVNLQTAVFPNCSYVGKSAFSGCTALSNISFPKCEYIGNWGFARCPFKSVSFPALNSVASYGFDYCSSLSYADLGSCATLSEYAFRGCTALSAVVLRRSAVCTLGGTTAFSETLLSSGTGYIYVPSSLVASYKTATNWTAYSSRISAIESM